jgi:hypothetical protein
VRAIIIKDAQGRQVFGMDEETHQQLYKQGVRSFPLSGGLTLTLLAALPNAADYNTQETLGDRCENQRDAETTIRHNGIYADG